MNGYSAPDELVQLLIEADKRNGFPVGTMASVMQQEIGVTPNTSRIPLRITIHLMHKASVLPSIVGWNPLPLVPLVLWNPLLLILVME